MPNKAPTEPIRMLELPAVLFLIRRIGAGNLSAPDAAATASVLARDARFVEAPAPRGELPGQIGVADLLDEVRADQADQQ